MIDRLRKAVPFDYIFISGLDVDHYRFGQGYSIDTDLPPAFVEAYMDDEVLRQDPFIKATKASGTVVTESEVYKDHEPAAIAIPPAYFWRPQQDDSPRAT